MSTAVRLNASPDPIQIFNAIVEEQVASFPSARLPRLVDRDKLSINHYHTLLTTLFHQTYSSPYTFARAAVNCAWTHAPAKEYLLQHAEEERSHWRWVLDDLAATGYEGPDPRSLPPHPSCQAYIGLTYYISEQVPVARLATASVLEGIGARHGGSYGARLLRALDLKSSQATFLLSHGETDKKHSMELRNVIAECHLAAEEWTWMNHAAKTAGLFYRGMYDHEAYDIER
jgi:Iron-containing redox enzyme